MKGSLAENLLCGLCYNEEIAFHLLLTIQPDMFDGDGAKLIAARAMEYIRKYNTVPGIHLNDLFESELRRTDDSGKAYNRIFAAMASAAQNLQPAYILDTLDQFVELSRIKKKLDDAKKAWEQNDVEAAKLAMSHQDMQVSFDHGIWLHKPEEALRFLNKTEDENFSSGIEELDKRGIRPARKTLTVMIAPPKSGKSWAMINQGKANLARRKSVMHITTENSEELTAKRYIQAFYAMATTNTGSIRLPTFNKTEGGGISFELKTLMKDPEVLNESQRIPLTNKLSELARRPPLLIKEFPSGTLTIPMLNAFLDVMERTQGFKPDLLIVDYPKLMKLDQRNYRLDLGRIMIELRGIAVARNIAVTTVMQGSKKAATAHVVTSTMASEDYSMVGTADTIITYSQTPQEKKIGLARILVDSARDAADAYLVMISQSYATGQFCISSAFMTAFLESEAQAFMSPPSNKSENDDDDD